MILANTVDYYLSALLKYPSANLRSQSAMSEGPKSGGKQKPPKKGSSSKESGSKKSSEAKESSSNKNKDQEKKPLQAILLADSFLEPLRFRPFTLDKPKVLLPLVNVPMLEYTLELLARNDVQDIIIFAAAWADQIVAYMNKTRWFHREPELRVTVMVSSQCRSVGDALRHVHESGRIVGDFVLVYGDVVSNLDLKPAIASHKVSEWHSLPLSQHRCRWPLAWSSPPTHPAYLSILYLSQTRAAAGSSTAMTLVLTPVPPAHSVRALDDDLVVATDALTGELVHYSNAADEDAVELPPELLVSRRAIRVRHDLMDSGIAICSPMLLLSFTDNFDKTDPRSDYLAMVLRRDESDVLNEDRVYVVRLTHDALPQGCHIPWHPSLHSRISPPVLYRPLSTSSSPATPRASSTCTRTKRSPTTSFAGGPSRCFQTPTCWVSLPAYSQGLPGNASLALHALIPFSLRLPRRAQPRRRTDCTTASCTEMLTWT